MAKKNLHITLDEELLKKARIKCVKEDRTLSQAITRVLREWVNRKPKKDEE